MKYRKKPITIDAIQYVGNNKKEIIDFTNGKARTNTCYSHLTIPTLEGNMFADVDDYIIKGIRGECYPCKPEIFKETYDALTENSTIIIQDEIKVTQKFIDETIEYYKNSSEGWKMGWLGKSWDKYAIIKELEDLTDDGKEFLLHHIEFLKCKEEMDKKFRSKNE